MDLTFLVYLCILCLFYVWEKFMRKKEELETELKRMIGMHPEANNYPQVFSLEAKSQSKRGVVNRLQQWGGKELKKTKS